MRSPGDGRARGRCRGDAGVLKNLELHPREPLTEALVSREALIDAVIPDVALVADAHAGGSLAPDFTEDDLFALLWLAGIASRDRHAPTGWHRVIERALDAAWTASK